MPYRLKIKLPPTNRAGIRTYYRHRGYRENPVLQSRKGATLTFVKPLPDGRRIHDRIYEAQRHFKIYRHIDRYDPGRAPVRHLLVDQWTAAKVRTRKIPRREKYPSTLRRLRKSLGFLE